jgi:hypothetical protein
MAGEPIYIRSIRLNVRACAHVLRATKNGGASTPHLLHTKCVLLSVDNAPRVEVY